RSLVFHELFCRYRLSSSFSARKVWEYLEKKTLQLHRLPFVPPFYYNPNFCRQLLAEFLFLADRFRNLTKQVVRLFRMMTSRQSFHPRTSSLRYESHHSTQLHLYG